MGISEAEFEAATRRAARQPHAVKALYDQARNRIVIELANGVEIAFDPQRAQGLENASATDLEAVEVTPGGLGLYFPRLDADFYIPAIQEGILGTRAWMAAQLGAKGGKAATPKKQAASRNNGKLGGRPRKCACV